MGAVTHGRRRKSAVAAIAILTACSPTPTSEKSAETPVPASTSTTTPVPATPTVEPGTRFVAEVWADNWFSLFVNGRKVGEDSVPVTTERSFNSEKISFVASYPLTIAMVTKDFKEDDTGLEYIGTDRQQIGDGGFIAQVTDLSTGEVIVATDHEWRGLVVHRAPLNPACEKSDNPGMDCGSETTPEPNGWFMPGFDDSTWPGATAYSENAVGVKEGYFDVKWVPQARLIWTSNLKTDNSILWRREVPSN